MQLKLHTQLCIVSVTCFSTSLLQSLLIPCNCLLKFVLFCHSVYSTIKELGYGEFGVVTLATWTNDDTPKQVAVKALNKRSSQKDKIKFFQEAALMAQFIHDNVIRMYGMVTKDPAMIVLEYAKKGDLRGYLISLQPE